MSQSTTVITPKKRGPKPTGKGVLVGVRLQPDLLAALDEFRQLYYEARFSRPEAIRAIIKDRMGLEDR